VNYKDIKMNRIASLSFRKKHLILIGLILALSCGKNDLERNPFLPRFKRVPFLLISIYHNMTTFVLPEAQFYCPTQDTKEFIYLTLTAQAI